MPLRALLFDLDGTVADTDKIHVTVFQELLAPHGVIVTEEFYKTKLSGGLNRVIFRDLFPALSDAELDAMAARKEAMFRERAKHTLGELDGLTRLLEAARKGGVRLAAVTNAPRLNADFLLDHLRIRRFFDTVVLGEDCAQGKPHPLPYLTAMQRLGVATDESLVFEDSVTGVTSGCRAGALVVGIATSQTPERLRSVGASWVVAHYAHLTPAALHRMLTDARAKHAREALPMEQQSVCL